MDRIPAVTVYSYSLCRKCADLLNRKETSHVKNIRHPFPAHRASRFPGSPCVRTKQYACHRNSYACGSRFKRLSAGAQLYESEILPGNPFLQSGGAYGLFYMAPSSFLPKGKTPMRPPSAMRFLKIASYSLMTETMSFVS